LSRRALQVERQKVLEDVLVRGVFRPTVGREDRRVEPGVLMWATEYEKGRKEMLSLNDINYTIWEFNKSKSEWSIVEAIQGTYDEATHRADELKTLYPESAFAMRTAFPVDRDEHLKQSRYYGKVLNKK
jgi:hypothetical protein